MASLLALSLTLSIWPGTAPPRGQDAAGALTREELQRALQQRDSLIAGLLRRVEELEHGRATGSAPGAPAVEPPAAQPPAPPGTTAAPTARPESPPPTETAQQGGPAGGQFEIDEEAADRALDFTLVQQGALLLPFGRAEFTPSFTYTRRAFDFPIFADVGGERFVGEREIRSNDFDLFAGLLVGLPFDSQLDLGLPYSIADQSTVDQVGGGGVGEASGTGHGLGDLSVGLAKTVLRQRGWWPDVVLRLAWNTGTGEREDNDVFLGGGFQRLTGSFSLAKRQDPLVFVGGAAYEAVFEDDDFDPGDSLSFSIGTFLAASPRTSLRLVLNQTFRDELEFDGQRIDGSDTIDSMLTIGASAVLGRDVLLDGAVGVGLTDDSPDYSVEVSLPIRFNLPVF